jgi:Ca-activated chloride channel homolog
MPDLMRCLFCGLLQDEPAGVKTCQRCGGELKFEGQRQIISGKSYLKTQMELDQINAPGMQMVDRYLLVTLRSPEKVPEEYRAKTKTGRPPLSLSIVLDVSGSMHGQKIEQTREALRMAARLLHEGDHLAMTVFSDEAKLVMKPQGYNDRTRKTFLSLVDELRPGGSTALSAGLNLGLAQAENLPAGNRLTLLLSDGQANIGETDLEVIGQATKKGAKKDIMVSTLGVGMDYNEALMTEIAIQGKGRFYHVQNPQDILTTMTAELGEAADLAAEDVKIQIDLPKGTGLMSLSKAYDCQISGGQALVSVGDLPLDLEVEIPLRLTVFPAKAGERLAIEGVVKHLTPSGEPLSALLNRVTVRVLEQEQYQGKMAVIQPVAEKVARQLHASQVLSYSRAVSTRSKEELREVEQARERLNDYLNLLDDKHRNQISRELKEDLSSIQAGSPQAKQSVYNSYMTSRSMRRKK